MTLKKTIAHLWLNPFKVWNFFVNIPGTARDYMALRKELKKNTDFKISNFFLITTEKSDESGSIQWHYFRQDLFMARRIFENKPMKHIDIWSRVDGFVAHVASFRDIEVFDIREQKNSISNIIFVQQNLMELPEKYIDYTDSISSLHAIEHFWLGRYGDPIDANWHIKWLDNITKILKKWWKFYFSVPIWPQRIEFNAHRVCSLRYLMNYFQKNYHFDAISIINDSSEFFENIDLDDTKNIDTNFWCNYWCWLFELTKK